MLNDNNNNLVLIYVLFPIDKTFQQIFFKN